ncbi:MAG: transcriptional repressor [Planctomycetota bacterium]|nr:MAG: transcriptional repressor [Planctomycetota bacterium]REK42201.1 MAG: transcriptional repressor [Planctomycetota bacterium]
MADTDESTLTVEDARERLRGAGLRSTSCRVAVLQHLASVGMPASHAEVSDQLVPSGFDKTTIYRSLIELAEVGIAARLDLGDHVWRFELLREGHKQHVEHPHFVCNSCGKVECLPDLNIEFSQSTAAMKESFGEVHEVLLKGTCAACE